MTFSTTTFLIQCPLLCDALHGTSSFPTYPLFVPSLLSSDPNVLILYRWRRQMVVDKSVFEVIFQSPARRFR